LTVTLGDGGCAPPCVSAAVAGAAATVSLGGEDRAPPCASAAAAAMVALGGGERTPPRALARAWEAASNERKNEQDETKE